MGTQAMDRKKREGSSYFRSKYEDYENGKPRDKKQKKLNEFMEKDG